MPHTATSADFAFDYTRGAKPVTAKPKPAKGWFMSWMENIAIARERSAMAQLAQIDPRLAREIQIARDRAEAEIEAAK